MPAEGPSVLGPRLCLALRVPSPAPHPPGSSSRAVGRSCAGGGMGGPADSTAASRSCRFPFRDLSLRHSCAVTSPATEPLPPVTQTRGGRADPMVRGPDTQGVLSALQLPLSFTLVSLFWNSPSQAGVGAGPSSAWSHLRPQLLSVRAMIACADNFSAPQSPHLLTEADLSDFTVKSKRTEVKLLASCGTWTTCWHRPSCWVLFRYYYSPCYYCHS